MFEFKIQCKGVIVAMMKQRWPSLQGGLLKITMQLKIEYLSFSENIFFLLLFIEKDTILVHFPQKNQQNQTCFFQNLWWIPSKKQKKKTKKKRIAIITEYAPWTSIKKFSSIVFPRHTRCATRGLYCSRWNLTFWSLLKGALKIVFN